MLKKISKILIIFIVGMIGGIFADQIFWPYFIERPLFYKYGLDQQPVNVIEKSEIYIQENEALQGAALKVKNSVVYVKTITAEGKTLEGSGLAVTSDGLIVTLNSLIPMGEDFFFFAEGKQASYQVMKRDKESNLALVKLGASNLSAAEFADLGQKKEGERIFLAGILSDSDGIPYYYLNEGIISSLSKDFFLTNILEKERIQGSPLFDVKGAMVGLAQVGPEGEVIGIPASLVKDFINI
jgi:hypothetical protein